MLPAIKEEETVRLLQLQLHHLAYFWQSGSGPSFARGDEAHMSEATELQVTPAPPGAAPRGQPGKQQSFLPEPGSTESHWDFTNNSAADLPNHVM